MKKSFLLPALLCGVVMMPHPAKAVSDAEFENLKTQMSMLAQRLEGLEKDQTKLVAENTELKRQNSRIEAQAKQDAAEVKRWSQAQAQSAAAIEPAAGAATQTPSAPAAPALQPGEFRLPGTDTTMKFGGYIKADAIHDVNVSRVGNGEDFALYSTIPLKGSAEEQKGGNTRVHARQTRLNLTTKTPTEYGDLKMFVEGDFYRDQGSQATTNAEAFGLRHAYGELGPVLIGQTWSNYMDMDAYPETLDYVGPSGITLLRQGQIRYTHKPDNSKNSYSVAVENPQSDFSSNPANPGADTNVNRVPDLTANAKFVGENGEVSVKGALRQLSAYNSSNLAQDKDVGYALGLSGKLNLPNKDDIRFQVAYGDGIGRYIYDAGVSGQGAGFSATGGTDDLETVEAMGGYAAYRHVWSDKLRSNLIAGTTQVMDNPSFLPAGTTNKSLYSGEANLMWAVTPKLDLGAGYIYGHRETESGAEGSLQRVQASGIFKF